MHKRLVSFGDSFTFGYQLSDCKHGVPSKKTYSALTAKWLELPYCCYAVGSNANQSITRNVLESDINEEDVVMIMWTFETRQDFLFDGERGWSSISPHYTDEFTKTFYKHIDSSLRYFQYLAHKEIFLVQRFLKEKNIDAIHLSVSSSLVDSIFCRDTTLSKLIDTTNWIQLPGPCGFFEWAQDQQLLASKNPHSHANEIAHKKLFDIIKLNFAWLTQR